MLSFLLLLAVLATTCHSRSAIRSGVAADENDYMPQGEHNSEYDHEAFLGHDQKAVYDNLPAPEAKKRLQDLIPHLDEDGDGQITVDELHDWIKKQLLVYIMDDANALHEGNDVNHDGFVSWKEFVATTYGLGFVDNEQKAPEEGEFDYRQMILRDYNKFISADANGDQFLSVDEMASFIHPEEFHHTRHLAIEESLKDLDRNGDGLVSVDEYMADLLADEEELMNDIELMDRERRKFNEQHDTDKDGFLNEWEVRDWLTPNNDSPSRAVAARLVAAADSNRNGVLEKPEIVRNYQVFVGNSFISHGGEL